MKTTRSAPGRLLAATIALTSLVASQTAQAYCRSRTCEFDVFTDCEEDRITGCSTVGELAHWPDGCIGFAVQRDGSVEQQISAEELRVLVDNGFDAWSSADCGGGMTPALTGVHRGEVACDAVEYNCELGAENNNIIMFRDGPSDLPRTTIALTTIIANTRTGEIRDADIEINSWEFDFTNTAQIVTELDVAINHELGHLLGLSHSRERPSLMAAAYGEDPQPQADDVGGMCDIFEGGSTEDPGCEDITPADPNAACLEDFLSCTTPIESESGCSVGSPGSGALPVQPWGTSLFVLSGLGLTAACRRRRSR